MAASQEVVGIRELLELVFSHYDTVDLVRAQRVCKDWDKVIKTTPSLQPIRFLKPQDVEETLTWEPPACIGGEWEPLVVTQAPGTSTPARHYPLVLLHPALSYDDRAWKGRTYFSIEFNVRKLLSWSRGAEWEPMYITQPPCKRAESHGMKLKIANESGVMLGQLRDAIEEHYKDDEWYKAWLQNSSQWWLGLNLISCMRRDSESVARGKQRFLEAVAKGKDDGSS